MIEIVLIRNSLFLIPQIVKHSLIKLLFSGYIECEHRVASKHETGLMILGINSREYEHLINFC